ncbi:MAG: DivIVA domain-containing protein [Frankiaceae bacterium]|nr:DivIVA domain-containing protein [Frankiaceae bacterium]MBV9872979.1 DivIVA domain-containing protein [Frankiaceae bacterium]
MVLILIVLAGVVILVAAALVMTLNDDGLTDEEVDHIDLGLPDRPINADDIADLRFRTAVRGYRMEDVDRALHQIARSMRESQR